MMEGALDEAERNIEKGKASSKVIGFQDGVKRANELLNELKKKR